GPGVILEMLCSPLLADDLNAAPDNLTHTSATMLGKRLVYWALRHQRQLASQRAHPGMQWAGDRLPTGQAYLVNGKEEW
ncbi:MAG: hypothetical protein AAGJ94_13755, partial [Pseudomonadota bacterium]